MNLARGSASSIAGRTASRRRISGLRILLASISALLFLRNLLYSFQMGPSLVMVAAILILAMSIMDAYAVADSWLLTIVFASIAYFNYSIVVANYLSVIEGSFFTSLAGDYVSMVGINVLLLFMATVTVLLPTDRHRAARIRLIDDKRGNMFLVLGISLALIFILIYSFVRPDVSGVRGTPSELYEYSLILFIVGYQFSGGKRFSISVLTAIMLLFVVQDIVYGGRATSIQLVICWFLFVVSYRTRPIRVLPWATALYVLFSAVGSFRASFVVSGGGIGDLVAGLVKSRLTLDTAYSAYYTSLTFIKVEALSSLDTRLGLFTKFLSSMVLGGSRVSGSSLGEYTYAYYTHYYGGLLPFYWHFYLGWFGVILSGIIVSLYCRHINRVRTNGKQLVNAICIFFACSVVRWYLYTPSDLIRGVGLTVFAYYFASLVDAMTRGRPLVNDEPADQNSKSHDNDRPTVNEMHGGPVPRAMSAGDVHRRVRVQPQGRRGGAALEDPRRR